MLYHSGVTTPPNVSPVTPADARRLLLERLGLRVGEEMAAYVLRRVEAADAGPIAIFATDARTGLPLQAEVDPADVQLPATAS